MKDLTGQLELNQRSDSELVLAYLGTTLELEYTRVGNMFILWKIVDNVLRIHDIYSEEGAGAMLEFASIFVANFDDSITHVEGYVDKEYSQKDRSDKILRKFGMLPYHENEEYVYYIMER